MKTPIVTMLAMSAMLLAAAGPDAPRDAVSFRRDVQPIFNAQCVVCHNAMDPHSGLVLDPGLAYSQLVGVASVEAEKVMRIAPGAPDESYLVRKIERTHLAVGGRGWWMPPPTNFISSITVRNRTLIRRWVEQGAKDN